MNPCQCCHYDDTGYHSSSNGSSNHVNDGSYPYNCNGDMNDTGFQYNQDLLQASPSQWESSEYYRQENHHHHHHHHHHHQQQQQHLVPSNIYKPIVYNTPPEEMLHALLREQNDEYCYPPYKNVASGTPLSPMSMQSVDSFDTVPSQKFDDLISSPAAHTPPTVRTSPIVRTSDMAAIHYVVNPSTVDGYYYQNFEQQQLIEQQNQYQLQLQHEFEHQQYFRHANSSQYNTSHRRHYHHSQRSTRRRYENTQPVTTHQHDSINKPVPSINTDHVLNDKEPNQAKRKRNSSRRTLPSQLICPTCSRKFTRPYNLKSHQRTHTKERPYICVRPGCTWTFARPHDLKRHDLLHSGIKKYVCSCGKPFARSDAFKRHQAVDKICSLRLKGNYM